MFIHITFYMIYNVWRITDKTAFLKINVKWTNQMKYLHCLPFPRNGSRYQLPGTHASLRATQSHNPSCIHKLGCEISFLLSYRIALQRYESSYIQVTESHPFLYWILRGLLLLVTSLCLVVTFIEISVTYQGRRLSLARNTFFLTRK